MRAIAALLTEHGRPTTAKEDDEAAVGAADPRSDPTPALPASGAGERHGDLTPGPSP